MVINLRRKSRLVRRANTAGHVWSYYKASRDFRLGRVRRCFLNGREITDQTFYCDTRRGIVRLYKLNAEGKKYLDPVTHEAAWEEKRGHVKLRRTRAA